MPDLILTGIGELVTNRPGAVDLLGTVADAAVVVRNGRIDWAGPRAEVGERGAGLPRLDVEGRAVLPGFVDAHTHLVFAGDRSAEFARRLRGESYEEITADGGGIHSTVAATRAADQADLVAGAVARARRMVASGTTTIEVKSGYGLDTETELRMLRAVAGAAALVDADLVPTFLGAHLVPAEHAADRAAYVDLVVSEMLPACAPYARYADAFCDRAAFSVEETRTVLEAAARHGLRGRLHAEQLARSGGAALAAGLGAVSADHLDHATPEDAALLAEAGTVAVLLPAASFALRTPQAPARMLWDAGVTVAIATDCNPGTSYTESMGYVVALAVIEMGLSPAEALWAATRGGALALEEPDKGIVVRGARADLAVLDAPRALHVPYRPATNLVWKTLKDGAVVSPPAYAGGVARAVGPGRGGQ